MTNSKIKQYCKELCKIHGNEYALRLMENTVKDATGKSLHFFRDVIIELKRSVK
jgi:hypothetical protein